MHASIIQRLHTYTPASNGVAERVNLTVLNNVRSMLLSSSLPSYFWIEVANYFILETTYGMDDDSEDEDHKFYFSLENCNLLDLAVELRLSYL